MEWQIIFNVGTTIIIALCGFILARIFKDIERVSKDGIERNIEQRKALQELENKIFTMNAHLPEKYVTKEELYRLIDKMFDKLDRISDKLDDKQDKE